MNYDSMSKDELITLLKYIQEKRAFTYEDQMKLRILDASPFTVWTSDRNCLIKMWGETCERLYGHKKDDVLGKNFIPLIVNPEEAPKARLDQQDIIDNGKPYHNVANDNTSDGRILTLITNCFRVYDIITAEPLNAEMGMSFDFLEEEKEKLNQAVSEYRKVKSCIEQFKESTDQFKEEFRDRKNSLLSDIRNTAKKAIAEGRTVESFKAISGPIETKLDELQTSLDEVSVEHLRKMQESVCSRDCEDIRITFNRKYDMIVDDFENTVLNYYEINNLFKMDNKHTLLKENIYSEIRTKNSQLTESSYKLRNKIDTEIESYRSIGNISANSSTLINLQKLKAEAQLLHVNIEKTADEHRRTISSLNDEHQLNSLHATVKNEFKNLENQLQKIEKQCNKEINE